MVKQQDLLCIFAFYSLFFLQSQFYAMKKTGEGSGKFRFFLEHLLDVLIVKLNFSAHRSLPHSLFLSPPNPLLSLLQSTKISKVTTIVTFGIQQPSDFVSVIPFGGGDVNFGEQKTVIKVTTKTRSYNSKNRSRCHIGCCQQQESQSDEVNCSYFMTHHQCAVRRRWEKRLAGNVPISSVLLLDGDSTRFVLTWRKMN